MPELLIRTWPWYVAGPIIGLFVPALLIAGNKLFGVSSNLRHLCAALGPQKLEFFRYDWKKAGSWNLMFVLGVALGGWIAVRFLGTQNTAVSAQTRAALTALGLRDLTGLVPRELISWPALLTLRGFISVVVGGFLIGFGTAYAGGCTSGHAISGLSSFQLPSLIAVAGFFAGGLAATYCILPLLI